MTKLHVKVSGNGAPLVLLHGWGWDGAIWQPLLPQLQQHFQVYVVDLPGCGKSTFSKGKYDLKTLAPLILDYVPTKATWLGWSMGGLFAIWIAIHYPECVSDLVTVACSPKFICDPHWPGIPLSVLEKFATLLCTNYEKTLSDFLELQLRGSLKKQELFKQLEKNIKNHASLQALTGGLSLLKETDLTADLKKIICPSLHIFGERDRIVPILVVSAWSALFPHGRYVVIPAAGHIPFLDSSEIFLKLINS